MSNSIFGRSGRNLKGREVFEIFQEGYEQGFVISIPILHKIITLHISSVFINSFSLFKVTGFKRFVAVSATAGQYGVFLAASINPGADWIRSRTGSRIEKNQKSFEKLKKKNHF